MPRSRHPRGLYVLFLSEMWERFSFYGMRALLILYLVNYLKWRQAEASNVYKWYTSLVFFTPILGGFLADRYLGNKRAVVIGALLMAAGHFLMAVEAMTAFYTALVLLIVGNGFFKPNISTQVGRLYPVGDPRRDSAYTIFYMGINLGAGISPIVCGVLADHTRWSYHAGFAAAGVGMLIGLVTYLVGLRWVVELPPGEATPVSTPGAAMNEAAASIAPPALPRLQRASPRLVAGFGLAVLGLTAIIAIAKIVGLGALGGLVSGGNLVSLGLLGACALMGAWILSRVEGAARERVLAIYAMAIFAVFFWAAFEQTGNAFNLWADKATNRHVTMEAPPPSPFPDVSLESDPSQPSSSLWEYMRGFFRWENLRAYINPFPTTWFQSANAFAIVIFGPVFIVLWLALARRRLEPSTPAKMAIGVVFMGLASAVMAMAARSEDRPSSTVLATLPPAMVLDGEGRLCEKTEDGRLAPFHAGRLSYDPSRKVLEMGGVLPDTERDRILRETAPAAYQAAVKDVAERSEKWRDGQPPITLALAEVPPGFDLRYAGFPENKVRFDPATTTLSVAMILEDKDEKALFVAAADPAFRDALNDLYVRSDAFRVSSWYLILCYLFMTFGELCLSPVGLSMVSKLAPARFATMLMGLWFLTNFFGTFTAGALGEFWGTIPPVPYFLLLVAVLGGAAVVAFIIGRKISALMHGVH